MSHRSARSPRKLRVGLVVPHIFMQRAILPEVIFSPAALALGLAAGLQDLGAAVTLFTPGPVSTTAENITADLSSFERELAARGDQPLDLLKKHPLTFITLARHVQAELIAQAYAMANNGQLDIVHIYMNEEEIALPFAALCARPVVFTHHDPFNFLVQYRHVFPRYSHLPWISLSLAQRRGMPDDTNWAGNVYHGLPVGRFAANVAPQGGYVVFLGRIIEPKGVHVAIEAVREYNRQHPRQPLALRIAGKHYAGAAKDTYWRRHIEPNIDGRTVVYDGFIRSDAAKQRFLGNARALIMPSLFDEPFGMVMIEALACGTPVVGLDSGAIPEIVDGRNGVVTRKVLDGAGEVDVAGTAAALARGLEQAGAISRRACRQSFEARFTQEQMCRDYLAVYQRLVADRQ